jgi:Icc-related predicted phosphoesterase
MKILAISDNVLPQMEDPAFLSRQYAGVNAIISCGDLPAPYLDLITSTLNAPLFFVRGNHDTQYAPSEPGGLDLHLTITRYNGFSFAGFEGAPLYNHEPMQYSETQMMSMVLSKSVPMLLYRLTHGTGIDVMVSHSPPRDIHDQPDRTHRGFRAFRLAIALFRPRYWLHGHVDTWDNRKPTVTQVLQTTVININPVKALTLERA